MKVTTQCWSGFQPGLQFYAWMKDGMKGGESMGGKAKEYPGARQKRKEGRGGEKNEGEAGG